MPAPPRIRVEDEGTIRFLRFLDRRLFDDATVREVGEQLLEALPKPAEGLDGCVLDFSLVDQISSAMLGKLILIQRRADASRVPLRLCELTPAVVGVFRSTNLDRLFRIDRDLAASRDAIEGRK